MLNFRQLEAVENKVKIAPSKDADILETCSWPLLSECFHHRACHRAKK